MTTPDLQHLKALALAATPGDWLVTDRTVYVLEHQGWRKGVEQFRNRFSCTMSYDGSGVEHSELVANAQFIAAANPAAILALVAKLEAKPAAPAAAPLQQGESIESDEFLLLLNTAYAAAVEAHACGHDHGTADKLSKAEDALIAHIDARLARAAAPLPAWIDRLKGSDPTIDDLIAHIEGLPAAPSEHDEPTHKNHPGHHDGHTCEAMGQMLADFGSQRTTPEKVVAELVAKKAALSEGQAIPTWQERNKANPGISIHDHKLAELADLRTALANTRAAAPIDYRYLNLDTLEFVASQELLERQIGAGGIIKSFIRYPAGIFVAASKRDFTEIEANLACKRIRAAAPAAEGATPREMAIAQAVRQACCNAYSPDFSAHDWHDAIGDIDLATIIRATKEGAGDEH